MIIKIPISQYENCILFSNNNRDISRQGKGGRTYKLAEKTKQNEQKPNQDSQNKDIRCENKQFI